MVYQFVCDVWVVLMDHKFELIEAIQESRVVSSKLGDMVQSHKSWGEFEITSGVREHIFD